MLRVDIDTGVFAQKDQFDFWNSGVTSVYSFDREEEYTAPFDCKVTHFSTHKMALGISHNKHDYIIRRDNHHIAQDGMDTISIQYMISGEEKYVRREGRDPLKAGELRFLDGAQTGGSHYGPHHDMMLSFNRSTIEEQFPNIAKLHEFKLRSGPLAEVFKNYLLTTKDVIETASAAEAEIIGETGVRLANDLLRIQDIPSLDSCEICDGTVLQAIRLCIKKNHASLNISPEFIANYVGISRAKLYRICKTFGGPMEMVRYARLVEAARLLRLGKVARVSDAAYIVGFSDRETFTRAFRKEFNTAPKDYMFEMATKRMNRPTGERKVSQSWDDLTTSLFLLKNAV